MPTYSQIEPNTAWIEEVEEREDSLLDCDVDFQLVSELDVLEEEGY